MPEGKKGCGGLVVVEGRDVEEWRRGGGVSDVGVGGKEESGVVDSDVDVEDGFDVFIVTFSSEGLSPSSFVRG